MIQFAFRPTGSITAALIYLFHHLAHSLKSHNSVHLIALDFSKAFDTVRHSTLAAKIASFPICDNVYNWIINFLADRQHQTKANGCISKFQHISASFVEGSGMGPVAYLLNASDPRPIDQNNKIFKYADDTYFIVCDSNTHTIPKELQHISEWATRHNLKLNQAKSQEIVLSLNKTPVSAATFLTRVESPTVLGITFNSKLRF